MKESLYVYRHDQKKMLNFKGAELVGEVERSQWPEAVTYVSSADLFLNTETLKGRLAFLHAIKLPFVINTRSVEVANFGLWTHEKLMKLIARHYIDAAKELELNKMYGKSLTFGGVMDLVYKALVF
ncbi:hypothetical protein [Pyrobaculum aerophilum]|uniref:hypothetical protein n=1 Tax=Pyrobaculum aerophilum TaxID=13773 RepID=UPI00216220F0|nr:hypothetical protein [Pyrobaculum aerophilum]